MSREEAARIEAMIAARPAAATLAERRAGFEAMAARFPIPDDVDIEEATFGGVPGRWVSAAGADRDRLLLWLHGGAFTVGSSTSYTELCARLSVASSMRVACIDYRLSPENVYPAALDDAEAAWQALTEDSADTMMLGGDSCGGNLAVALTQRLVASRDRVPAALYLVSPYLDLTHSGDSVASRADLDAFVRPEGMPGTAKAYVGDASPTEPGASPLFGSVEGFPPVLTHVGSREVLFDDAARLHAKLGEASIENDLVEWEGMLHVFPFFGPMLEEGRNATAKAGAWLRDRAGGTTPRA